MAIPLAALRYTRFFRRIFQRTLSCERELITENYLYSDYLSVQCIPFVCQSKVVWERKEMTSYENGDKMDKIAWHGNPSCVLLF